jgi:GTP-binding protein EngB required for normal cell division
MLSTNTPARNPDNDGRSSPLSPLGKRASSDPEFDPPIDFVSSIAQRYELSSLVPLLTSTCAAASQHEVSVAVVGRFKAGKSSFLNHFTNRSILPVGVVPVTAVVTEIRFGPAEKATVHFMDGRIDDLPVDSIAQYVSERENPENSKRVRLISIELPGLERFRGLKFVDTPGLESALLHNTEEALNWLPNVGLALVAVSVDPPLSQQDIELLTRLYRFTPNVTVLLTKVDLIDAAERAEVMTFVTEQLQKAFEPAPQVVPYSVRPGYEDLKASLEGSVFQPVLSRFSQERGAIIRRKIDTLLRECADYVTLSLKSAELAGTQRHALKEQLIGQREVIGDVKAQLRLIAHHAAAGTRTFVETHLQSYQKPMEDRLLNELDTEFTKWTRSLAVLLDSFDQWMGSTMRENLTAASAKERSRFSEPLERTSKQVVRILQDFRDRLSAGTMQAFGVPLRTTEVEIEVQAPETPDIHVGKIFDRNWELLSPIMPVVLIKGLVRRHFERQVSYKLFTNISRLVSQWEERINSALLNMEKEAERRLDELVATVGHLIETGASDRVPAIREDLERIEALRNDIADRPDARRT